MKVLSFSATEVLPALLDRSKTSTIRPLFCNLTYCQNPTTMSKCNHKPRFKVGEKAQIMWKQRSPKGSWFCKKCGSHNSNWINFGPSAGATGMCRICKWEYPLYKTKEGIKSSIKRKMQLMRRGTTSEYECTPSPFFPKILGTVEITEVFEIEMGRNDEIYYGFYMGYCVEKKTKDGMKMFKKWAVCDLAKKDGFKSAKDMFKWFDKNYDLSKPKRFAVYRWRWL